MNTLEITQQIQQTQSQMSLTLDSPKSVKLQIKQISLLQKQLRAIKKEVNANIRNINQEASQSGTDSVMSVGLDIFGKHKWAGRLRAEARRAIEREKKFSRQPYLEIKEAIDNLILEADRLKLLAQYLINQ
ncbi:MAG: hypothetical protein V7K18_17220 [Nostoc sp.]|uniref:hypothetical protein n=1 Tax=Nostoc sp. TaxID=1180 RepID=UPI002FF88B8D